MITAVEKCSNFDRLDEQRLRFVDPVEVQVEDREVVERVREPLGVSGWVRALCGNDRPIVPLGVGVLPLAESKLGALRERL